jgi:hypothetical protein
MRWLERPFPALSAPPTGLPLKVILPIFQFARRIDPVAKLIARSFQTSHFRFSVLACTQPIYRLSIRFLFFPSFHPVTVITLLCPARSAPRPVPTTDSTQRELYHYPLSIRNSIMRLSFFSSLFAFSGIVAASFDFWTNTNVVV